MKPVRQTLFGNKVGNCYPAALASVLEVPLETVPNFCEGDDPYWTERCQEWLSQHFGLTLLRYYAKEGRPAQAVYDAAVGTWCMLSGPSPRGNFDHTVVGQVQKAPDDPKLPGAPIRHVAFVHDPHPSDDFLKSLKEVEMFGVVDPATRTSDAALREAKREEIAQTKEG